MKAYEMIQYLEMTWKSFEKGEPANDVLKGILNAMSWQPFKERQKVAKHVVAKDSYPEDFIIFVGKIIEIKLHYQKRLL